MPYKCPAAFLARIILPHQEVAGVPKSEIGRTRDQLLSDCDRRPGVKSVTTDRPQPGHDGNGAVLTVLFLSIGACSRR